MLLRTPRCEGRYAGPGGGWLRRNRLGDGGGGGNERCGGGSGGSRLGGFGRRGEGVQQGLCRPDQGSLRSVDTIPCSILQALGAVVIEDKLVGDEQ